MLRFFEYFCLVFISANPACNKPFQRKTTKAKGCQIDYFVQTKLGVLYLCEIKFTRSAITNKIIDEVQEKINHIAKPKNMSVVPILLHIGGIEDLKTIAKRYLPKVLVKGFQGFNELTQFTGDSLQSSHNPEV